MSWSEVEIWALFLVNGILLAVAFGYSLGAPYRLMKHLERMPEVPKPTPWNPPWGPYETTGRDERRE